MSSLADLPNLTGFFSYSRRDDQHSQDSLSHLRDKIFDELRMQLGFDVTLWKDTEGIRGGTEWEGEINRAISQSVFFIPIVTPSLVTSNNCYFEIKAFLDREEALGRKDLIFPLLYVRVPALEREELWREHPMLSIIGRRQFVDWQNFRHRDFTEAEIKAKIAQFCRGIVESLQEPWLSPEERRAAAEAQRIAEQARRDQEEKQRQQAEAESRRKAEQDRRAAEEAEAKHAERVRRTQVTKKRQQADAESRQMAEAVIQAAEKAKAKNLAEQARRDLQEQKRQQPRANDDAKVPGSTDEEAPKPKKSGAQTIVEAILRHLVFRW
jgi:flagellar biosynthesis GTPase FlhF